MKKLLCFFLAAILLLGGCSIVQEDEPALENEYADEPLLKQAVDLVPSITVTPALYFLDQSANRLSAETRTLNVPQDERAETRIVEALIEGPSSDTLLPVADGFTLDNIEVLPDVINVYLTQDTEKSEDEVMIAKLAITASLVDFSGEDYVNIFIDGMQTAAYDDMATGLLQKSNNSLQEDLAKYQRDARAETASLSATLYFLDASEKFLLPEVRSITFDSIEKTDMIAQLVREIMNGPFDTYNHLPIVDATTLQLNGVNLVVDDNGNNIVQLDFNQMPVVLTSEFQDGAQLAIATFTDSIVGFIPDICGIQIYVNGEPVGEDSVYRPSDFSSLLGNSILLYLPNSTDTLLTGINRMVPQDQAGYPDELLSELMKGPSSADTKAVMPAFMTGITMDDVGSVYLADDIAVVDFKSSIEEKMREVPEKNEFVMIYSIINTLTTIDNIKRVQLLVEGERVEYLGGGQICVIDPMVKNPGIVRLT